MEDDGLPRETRDDVRGERGVRVEEFLDEAVVVTGAPENEQLEVGERLGQVGRSLEVHRRRIGRGRAPL
jgi:hypothetical protein